MLLCTLTGNVDLSVGSVVCFVSAVLGITMVDWAMNPVLAVVIALAIGAVIGAFQGAVIAFIHVPPFIATLAGMLMFRGIGQAILDGKTRAPFPKEYNLISTGYIGDPIGRAMGIPEGGWHILTILIGIVITVIIVVMQLRSRKRNEKYGFNVIPAALFLLKVAGIALVLMAFTFVFAAYRGFPNILIVLAVLIVGYQFMASRTVQGRHIYALGGNIKAAKLSGIKTDWVMFWIYTNMAILSAVAAIVFTARLNSATPMAGTGFEMDAIAACYVGGSAVTGGVGTIIGAVVGGLFIGVLNNGMVILGLSTYWQQVIKGIVLLAAVAFDLTSKARSK
jgi:putative multiple sugar transport system permease protein